MSTSYTVIPRAIPKITSSKTRANRLKHYPENKTMKLSFKQKLRNWLLNDDSEQCYAVEDSSGPDLHSNSFRLNIYGASGGTIIETTKYDQKKDENRHSLHVVTEDKDLGEELSKIITMEQLR